MKSLKGGFIDTIYIYTADEGLSLAEFKIICEKRAESMTSDELKVLNSIRFKQLKPSPDILVQKVIPAKDIENYISGKYKALKGFISICADVKQLVAPADFYYGLRLDYKNSPYCPDDKSVGIIRFRAVNITSAIIPRTPENGGEFTDSYPFGGAGFTTGSQGRSGTPEWVLKEFAVLEEAQIFEIFSDGSEKIRAVYNKEKDYFEEVI